MLLTILNIIIFAAFLIGLYVIARIHVSFPKRVFTALVIGIVFEIAIHLIYGLDSKVTRQTIDWFSIVGDGYISFLQMIVIPLIFISIVSAFTKINIGEKFAKIGISIFIFLIGIVAIVAILCTISALVVGVDASTLDFGSSE